ncbi:hypothetical protein LXL04_026367 [Taraxacum kok-saghyz]
MAKVNRRATDFGMAKDLVLVGAKRFQNTQQEPFRVIRDPPDAAERLTTSPIFLGSSEDLSLQRLLTN